MARRRTPFLPGRGVRGELSLVHLTSSTLWDAPFRISPECGLIGLCLLMGFKWAVLVHPNSSRGCFCYNSCSYDKCLTHVCFFSYFFFALTPALRARGELSPRMQELCVLPPPNPSSPICISSVCLSVAATRNFTGRYWYIFDFLLTSCVF